MGYSHGLIDGFALENDPVLENQLVVSGVPKDDDEIERFTIKDDISEQEKLILFLSGSQPVQQLRAIENLPQLLMKLKQSECTPVLTALESVFFTFDEELQSGVGETIVEILQEQIQSLEMAKLWARPVILNSLSDKNRYQLSPVWYIALRELQTVSTPDELEEIVCIALKKGKVENGVEDRQTCCRLLGSFAEVTCCDARTISVILTQTIALCQDTDYQVKTNRLNSVDLWIRYKELLPELIELLRDENIAVKVKALEAFISSMSVLDAKDVESDLLPVLKEFIQPRDLEYEMQVTLSRLFGAVLEEVARCCDIEQESALFLSSYRYLASRKDHDLRKNCAWNLPGLLQICGHHKYPAYLHDIFTQLAADSHEDVRYTIAAQFFEVAKMVPPDVAGHYLLSPLEKLVKDDQEEVQLRVLQNLGDVLQRMEFIDVSTRTKALEPLIQGLIAISKQTETNWRLQESLIVTLSSLVKMARPEVVYSSFIPVAFEFLIHGSAAVKISSAKSLASFFRAELTEKQRTTVYLRVLRDFWNGRSCWLRMSFIDLGSSLLQLFSANFFKTYFLDYYIDILYDPVPNVRWHALELLPRLKQTIKLPQDVQKLERLNSAMSNLMMDRDIDVCERARSIHLAFKQTPLDAGMLDMNGTAGGISRFDEEDQGKQSEEVDMVVSTEEAELLRAEKNGDEFCLRLRNTRMSDSSSNFIFPDATYKAKKAETNSTLPNRTRKVRGRGRGAGTQSLTGSLLNQSKPKATLDTALAALSPTSGQNRRKPPSARPSSGQFSSGNSPKNKRKH